MQTANIGYELVDSPLGTLPFRDRRGLRRLQGHSFRIRNGDKVLVNCPLWFGSRAAARGCAEDMVRKVTDDLKRRGFKVEVFTGASASATPN